MANQNNVARKFQASLRNLRCGSCAGLHRKWPGYQITCADEGMLPTSKACRHYTPDYCQLTARGDSVNTVVALIEAIRNTPANLMQHMAYLMISAERIQRFLDGNFYLLEKVYYRYRGVSDYLSNFCWAYILDADANGITLLGKSGEIVLRIDWNATKNSLYTEEQFAVLRDEMMAGRKVYDPTLDNDERKVVRTEMRNSATKDLPTGDLSLDAVSGAVNKEMLESANLADLFGELGKHGTVGRTADKETWKSRLSKRRELTPGGSEGGTSEYAFDFSAGQAGNADADESGEEAVEVEEGGDDDAGIRLHDEQ